MTKPTNPEKKIPLVESFGPTIQGEGSVIGYQTMFLRLGGCDYRCEKCDSLFAVLPELFNQVAVRLTAEELLEHTLEISGHTEWITISGGNPCMWDLTALVEGLQAADKKVAVETQGTLFPDWLLLCDKVTISPKGPGMGEVFEPEKFNKIVQVFMDFEIDAEGNRKYYFIHPGFAVKVVIFDQRDIEFMVDLMERWPGIRPFMYASIGNVDPPAPAKRIHTDDMPYEEFVVQTLRNYERMAEEIWNDPRCSSVCILPQLHTLVWGNKPGV